jgi:glucose-specific phosphotransferase system IIA component
MRSIEVLAPFTGRVIPIEDVPDPVFADKIVGDGLAVEPTEGLAYAPIGGELAVFVGSGHAFAMRGPEGLEIIVHVGLDTVNLHGQGFEKLAEVGVQVEPGQALVRFDIDVIRASGYSLVSPVVLANLPAEARLAKTPAPTVRAGRDVLLTVQFEA